MMRFEPFASGRPPRYGAGFSLIEVMVALIIISIGLLGIAKLQAVVLSSTGTAGKRSLGAVAAASIASSMHADRAYWSLASSATATLISGATIASSPDPSLVSGVDCWANAPCTTVQMAAYDLTQWAISAQTVLPSYQASILCPVPAAASLPNTCTITLTWTENTVAANQQGVVAAGVGQFQTPTYVLYVQP
jgi:type IV pilus assembly protein PilV